MRVEVDVESLAVSIISAIISRTGYLVPFIPSKDRGPSFDGCVIVYKKKGMNHRKSDIVGRVDVQVKGCTLLSVEQSKASYSVEVDDIKNFLQAGGAMLLVVSFDSNGENEQAYYARLLPFDLKRILKECSEKQQTKSVQLNRMPSNKDEISDLFFNYIRDYELQRAYIHSTFEIDEKRVRKDNFLELSFGYTTVQNNNHSQATPSFNYLFSHGAYLYAGVGYDLKMPIDYIERINTIFREKPGKVLSGRDLFYDRYSQVYYPDHEEIIIGKSHKFILSNDKMTLDYTYSLNGCLKERVIDEKFFVAVLENKNVNINGNIIPLEFKDNSDRKLPNIVDLKKHIEWVEKIDRTLQIVHAEEDLYGDELSDEEELNIHLLVEGIYENKQVNLNLEGSSFGTINFGNHKILVCALQRKDNGKYDLYSYYDAPVNFKVITENDEEFESSYFVMLNKEVMIRATNIDLPEIISRLQKVQISQGYINQVTLFLLELIKAYDETTDEKYYESAVTLCDWLELIDKDGNIIHYINKCQLLKRRGLLSDNELNKLRNIENVDDPLMKTGIFLLLGKKEEARNIYTTLGGYQKNIFDSYPISKLFEM